MCSLSNNYTHKQNNLLVYFITMSRNTVQRSRYKKYDYKTHHSSFTQRSQSQHHTDPSSVGRKTSAFKIRKQTTQNSMPIQEFGCFEDIRLPLGEIFQNSAKVARALIDPRKDTRSLRQRNGQLEQKLNRQAQKMEQLRLALADMQGLLGTERNQEGQQLREANLSLQARCEAQDKEMATLRKEVENLRLLAENGAFDNFASRQMNQSNISRRAEYARNYQEVASTIPKPNCPQCLSFCEEAEKIRLTYEREFKKLQVERTLLREQNGKIAEMEAQIQHKNKCIDYLRSEVQQYERSSKHIVGAVCALQDGRAKRGRGTVVKSKPDETFNSFSEFRY